MKTERFPSGSPGHRCPGPSFWWSAEIGGSWNPSVDGEKLAPSCLVDRRSVLVERLDVAGERVTGAEREAAVPAHGL